MLVSRLYVASVLWCARGYGRRRALRIMVLRTHGTPSRLDPCMPGWFDVGRLFIVGSSLLQQFDWYVVVLAALWSACASWGQLRCSPRRGSRMLSLLSSRLLPRFVAAGLSNVAVIVLRPGHARRIVLVR